MNTIGKILVILNLVFAILVGGFLIIDFATRSNWKKEYEKLQSEMTVAKSNTNVTGKTLQDIVKELKNAQAEKEDAKQKLVEEKLLNNARLENQKRMTEDAENRAKDADLSRQIALAEKDRLKVENKGLAETVQDRDGRITALQEENKKYRTEAIAQEINANQTQERNVSLLGQIETLLRKIALHDAGVGNDNMAQKNPNSPNPPSNYIKGKIEKVDPTDRSLVTISLGSDQGLKLNHTLEVFRLGPSPQYLGMIRIEDVRQHVAVGKLVRSGVSGNRGALQPGDIVASSLKNQAQ